jgi:hypothetical protein
MSALIFSVYALGALTIISFVVFAILLLKYLFAVPQPPQAPPGGPVDQLQAIDIQKILNSARELLDSLNKAKPVAIAALITILFLVAWLVALSLLVSAQAPH